MIQAGHKYLARQAVTYFLFNEAHVMLRRMMRRSLKKEVEWGWRKEIMARRLLEFSWNSSRTPRKSTSIADVRVEILKRYPLIKKKKDCCPVHSDVRSGKFAVSSGN